MRFAGSDEASCDGQRFAKSRRCQGGAASSRPPAPLALNSFDLVSTSRLLSLVLESKFSDYIVNYWFRQFIASLKHLDF